MPGRPLAAIIRSSDRVAERQKAGTYHGDTDQQADVHRYCQARGCPYELLPPELDISGALPIEKRPSLRAAIEGCENGTYSGIVAANLKRLTRSRSGLTIWERVEAAGGHVHTAAEQIDTSTPNGRFMRDIFLADAVREREEHSERHAKRRAATVEAGMWRQHQLPLGYEFVGPAVGGRYRGAARRLKPSSAAQTVLWAFQQRAAGMPLVRIAEALGMTPSGVRHLLGNRIYLGELWDGETVNREAAAPIVDVGLFEAAQVSTPRPPRSVDDGPALLAGIVRCSACRRVMSRARTKTLVYRCARVHSGGVCQAPASITCTRVDEHVTGLALAELARIRMTDSAGNAVERARQALEDAEAELAAFLRATSFRDPGFEQALEARREAVSVSRESLRQAMGRAPALSPDLGPQAWEVLTAWERNELLRSLFAAVVVTAAGRGRTVPVEARVQVFRVGDDFSFPDA